MPFQSLSQMRGAFSGAFGSEMKSKAKQWAAETPNISKLPTRKKQRGKVPKAADVMSAQRN